MSGFACGQSCIELHHTGPPLSPFRITTLLSHTPVAFIAATVCPIAASTAEIMPRYVRRSAFFIGACFAIIAAGASAGICTD